MNTAETEVAISVTLRGVQRRLDQIQEVRDAHALSEEGMTEREIAEALLTTQAKVRRLLRTMEFAKVWPEEIILRAAVDGGNRAALVQQLTRMAYTFGQHDPTGGDGYRRGTWDDIESAAGRGLLSKDEYNAVLAAVVDAHGHQ